MFTASHRGGSGPPLLLLHGFMDTWRTWELVLPRLERDHDLLAPTLAGHAGGPPLDGPVTDMTLVEAVERALDEAGIETTHVAGNSLGGFLALQLAARGRARSVTALAPAGGWTRLDPALLDYQLATYGLAQAAAPHADAIASTHDGRRRATLFITERFEHIPAALVAHQIRGVAACAAEPLLAHARAATWSLDTASIDCPVRIVWGTEDKILPWPAAAARFRESLPHADWVVLDGVGHCPQLDVPLETAELVASTAA